MKKFFLTAFITFSLFMFLNAAFAQEVPGGESNGIELAEPGPILSGARFTVDNYPNPVINTTTVRYTVPVTGRITLKIYNTAGKEVITLFNGFKEPGTYNIKFDAGYINRGIYICSLSYTSENRSFIISKKINIIK